MIKEYKISENVLELEDLMVNYLYGKGDYPPKVREALDNLNNAILDTYSEQTIEDYAMNDITDYYVEVLPKTVLKHLKFSADIDYFYILREIKYVKEGVNNGSKDK